MKSRNINITESMAQHIIMWSYILEKLAIRRFTKTDLNVRDKLIKAQKEYNARRSKLSWEKKKRKMKDGITGQLWGI